MNEISERKGRKRDKKVVDIDITDLYLIFQYLQRTDKNNIRLVCKYFNNIITQIDKNFYVLKVDFGIENCLTLSVAIRSTLDLCIKIPSDTLSTLNSRETRNEFCERAAVNFVNQVNNRIISLDADCKSENFLTLIIPKLTRLKKIFLRNDQESSSFSNAKLLGDMIRNNHLTLEELYIIKAKLDQEYDIILPNLKNLYLEQVSGEKCLLSLLKCILNHSTNLKKLTLWQLEIQKSKYYIHNVYVTSSLRKYLYMDVEEC